MMELSYRRHRFPPVVIQHAVWLYLRFTLSYRDVEDLLAERGFDISYETVRSWVLKFGPVIARRLRQRRPPVLVMRPGEAQSLLGEAGQQDRQCFVEHRARVLRIDSEIAQLVWRYTAPDAELQTTARELIEHRDLFDQP